MIEVDYKEVFEYLAHNYILFAPDVPKFTIVDISDVFLKTLGMKREDVVGYGLFERFPDNPNGEVRNENILMQSMMNVITKKQKDLMPIVRYDIPIPGTDEFQIRYWTPESYPVLNKEGNIKIIIHTALDVTNII